MPLYQKEREKYVRLKRISFQNEKELQNAVEGSLEEIFDMHFLASEYSTTSKTRIDTLAIDLRGSPVIIEYKWRQDQCVINQGLSYLKWLNSQKEEFFRQLVVDKLGEEKDIDWQHKRVVCIAQSFNKFDLDSVSLLPANVELYTYRLYENGMLVIEPINVEDKEQKPLSRKDSVQEKYSIERLLRGKNKQSIELFNDLREGILSIDEGISERPLKKYVAYTLTKNFAEVDLQSSKLTVAMRTRNYDDPKQLVQRYKGSEKLSLGCYIHVTDEVDMDYVLGILQQSYEDVL